MTRVAVWGRWAKLSCTPRLWEALSAVSTEAGWAGWAGWQEAEAQRTAQAGSRLLPGSWARWPLWPSAVPVSVLRTRGWIWADNACHCRPGEVVPASQDEPIPWVCARQASEGALIQSPSRSRARSTQRATRKNFTSHLGSLKCDTTWAWAGTATKVGIVHMQMLAKKPWVLGGLAAQHISMPCWSADVSDGKPPCIL